MNKRQRKKQLLREFSKLYDKSFKYGGFKRNMSIATFRDKRGMSRMFLILNKSIDYRFGYDDLAETCFDGYCLESKTLRG